MTPRHCLVAHGTHTDPHEPTLCACTRPRPDAIGECLGCHRPVLSYLHPNVLARLAEAS